MLYWIIYASLDNLRLNSGKRFFKKLVGISIGVEKWQVPENRLYTPPFLEFKGTLMGNFLNIYPNVGSTNQGSYYFVIVG